MKHSTWLLEAILYISLVAIGAILYIAINLYGIPYYYCQYYYVCF